MRIVRALAGLPVLALLLLPAGCGDGGREGCAASSMTITAAVGTSGGSGMTSPLIVSGRLTTGGAPVASADLTLAVQRQGATLGTVATTTDAAGEYRVDVAAAGPRLYLQAQNSDAVTMQYAGDDGHCATDATADLGQPSAIVSSAG